MKKKMSCNSFSSDSDSFSSDSDSSSSDSYSYSSDSEFSPFFMQEREVLPFPVLPHVLLLKDYEGPIPRHFKVSQRGFNSDSYTNDELNMIPECIKKLLQKESLPSNECTENNTNTNNKLTNRRTVEVYRGPAKGFLEDYPGWIHQKKARLCGKVAGKHFDNYYWSPKTGKRFDSAVQAQKFLNLLEETNGDEDKAFAIWKSTKSRRN